jgi:hypothetical protein
MPQAYTGALGSVVATARPKVHRCVERMDSISDTNDVTRIVSLQQQKNSEIHRIQAASWE